jgi:hypothetical protein
MINRLIEIISKEAALFESFLELLELQKEMLVTDNLEGLAGVTEQHQQKLLESRRLGKQREELVDQIRAVNAIDGDLTVTRLLEHVDEDQANRLLHLRELIFGLNEKINETRNTNAMLLNQSREFIARTMATLAKINNPRGSSYAPAGVVAHGDANVMVDRRA